MSIVNYLGCNFILPISDNEDISIGELFPDAQLRRDVKKHFSTMNVFEVSHRDAAIWFNDDYRNDYPESNAQSEGSFQALCRLLDSYLEEGEYCEFYTCWLGDEKEERNITLDQCIKVHNYNIHDVQIYEKTLIVIKK